MITCFVRPLAYAACIAAVLGSTIPSWSQDPLAEAFTRRNVEFSEIKATLAAAQDKLGELEQDVSRVAAFLENHPDLTSVERVEVTDQLQAAALRLHRHAALGRFRAFADKLTQATDAAHELESLTRTLRDADVGATLGVLSATAVRLGADTVVLNERIQAYGRLAATLTGAIDRLAGELNVMRGQARLGSESYGGANDPRYRQLADQLGQTLADAAKYLPSSPWEVFRPAGGTGDTSPDVALIWDDQEQHWYRIEGSVPVETIFRDACIGLDQRPSPGKLKYLAENFTQVKGQQAAAEAFASYLSGAAREANAPPNQAFSRLAEGGKILASLRDAATFQAKFVYDGTFRAWTLQALDTLRRDLVNQGSAAEQALRDLDVMSRKYAITLESQWAQGILPETGNVRVVAWFSDNPKNRFASTWQFEREKVTIDVINGHVRNNGHAQGIRTGNVVHSERSIPGRNCIASDERVFEKGGILTFSSVYVCTLDDGTTRINEVTGAGTWEVVSPPPKSTKTRSKAAR